MSLESDLYAHLTGVAAVSSAIGARLYPSVAPASATLPYAVFSVVSTERWKIVTGEAGMAQKLIQFDAYATSDPAAETVADAIRGAMSGLRRVIGSTSIRRCFCEPSAMQWAPPADASQMGTFRRTVECSIMYAETPASP